MKPLTMLLLVASISLWAIPARSLEVRVEPQQIIYASESGRRLGIYDIMVQTIAVINDSSEPVDFDQIVLEAVNEGEVVLIDRLLRENHAPVWKAYHSFFTDPQVQKSQDSIILFSRVLPDGVALADSLTLEPGTAFIIRNRALVFSGYLIPDSLRVRATATTSSGKQVSASTSRRVARYEQKNDYVFPLRGRWYVSSSSSIRSHHRLRLAHEFALDLMRIGSGGKSYRTDGSKPADYYAFGEDVVAVAQGTVVAVEAGVQDTEMPNPGESRRDFAMRVLDAMWEKDPTGHTAGGNFVVIEHEAGEHSVYVHMRHGSVTAVVGDHVEQGQAIGQVGISGDGFEPHLHFGVMDGPDMSYSQGLPVRFTNVRPVGFSSTLDMKPDRLYMAGEFIDAIDHEPDR